MAYHYTKALELPSYYWALSAWHGVRMDISFAGYLLVLPTLLMAFTFKRFNWYKSFIHSYSLLTTFIIALLVCVDLELFRAWGFRIDATSLHYLQSPREAWASMSSAPVGFILSIGLFLFGISYWLLTRIAARTLPQLRPLSPIISLLFFIIAAAAWIIPIRGGLQLAPMNQSTVYFSEESFANYAAVNVPWNYSSSLIHQTYNKDNPFRYLPDSTARQKTRALYDDQVPQLTLVDSGRINVIVLIWESFTAKIVGTLGGLPGITPQFDQLAQEGILFTNIYASGDRSDKGMVSILSGYPAQPTRSIIKIPTKTLHLPSLPKNFKQQGYSTAFYYGGETEFANMKSYFLQQKFDNIVDIHAFNKSDMNSKWGAHDHVVLNRFLSDLDHAPQPFFNTLFTLSSHEPFEVPVPTVIAGTSQEKLFLNALHYTDRSIGDFVAAAKTKPWWKNTLLVIIADHGHPMPATEAGKPSQFHIPMLWLGGALKNTGLRINTLASQTDLASTLLHQLGKSSHDFEWSNDIFDSHRQNFAYFAFNNGFGWVRPQGYLIHDNIGGNIIGKEGNINPAELENGKAYLQTSFGDYLSR
ncbi:phosphoglycerol transferase MdoB-like AlkP superfamily enzyme [Dyadobacter jejuensis]|uniref:Phosphoglycerol transferase MdoB-like AlkP superfamily enzyme n=1 Tax=Dyadobacter jejuensis TaxID=1082580 RepID=A0A316AMB8_9BACT|nr:LTA synthase family protein [Dyadobacter jejuensis]PWJ58883.1 phosphoglycerol transferase MdoB-like AlkP superfamily enzyme [Dyadobacter jejuensis]